ncbi:uncharacterized protein K02A2.6-like [Eupeodes corollae]|uniref:uncharacterized protein K02A2.6-like n=1 Tax=Eupeodes corollae TaxID=290404 RepID=UPI002491E5B1|nr:uncharacterized protein K02A2.6-like [Eupeodes corollae]
MTTDNKTLSSIASKMSVGNFRGNIDPFIIDKDDFEQYADRLKHIFVLNAIGESVAEEKQKVSIFVSFVGADLYKILRTLIAPKSEWDFSYDELIKIMKQYFKPKLNVRAERFKFMSRRLKDGETLQDFVVELKSIAENCEYGAFLDQALSDKFIWSQRSSDIQRKLLNEPLNKTFNEIFESAQTMESTQKDVKDIQSTLPSMNIHGDQNWIGRSKFRMGNSNHRRIASRSKARNHDQDGNRASSRPRRSNEKVTCFRCQKEGHYAYDCGNNRVRHSNTNNRYRNKNYKKVNHVDGEQQMLSNLTLGNVTINSLSSEYLEPLIISLKVNNININMEVDSGACLSILSERMYLKLFKNCRLKPFDKTLNVITGENVVVVGAVEVAVNGLFDDKIYCLDLVVVRTEKDFTPLLGRNWLNTLFTKWRNHFKVNSISPSRDEVKNEILKAFPQVFDNNYYGIIRDHVAEIVLDVNASPIFHKPYTVPYGLREKVEKELGRLVEVGILKPVRFSEWATPIVVVEKKDGTIRICMDCKSTINRYVRADHYPIPRIDDILSCFGGCSFFCILDLAGAFQQVALSEQSQKYVTINTDKGLFQYTRLPFGIKSAPSIFQCVIDDILKGLKYVRGYIDDIIIGGSTLDDCKANLIEVLRRFNQLNVKVRIDKCQFFKSSVEYLGHEINGDGIHPKANMMKAIVNAPAPVDVSSLKAYLGLLNFYNKFIPNLSARLAPLYDLLKKEKSFDWNQDCEKVFNESKCWLYDNNMLVHYSPDKALGIVCDASSYGVGGVLFHIEKNGEERPIMFVSSTLSNAEKNYSQIEREALAVIFSVKRFHKYIYGRKITIYSDHKPLENIFGDKKNNAIAAARLQRWALILSQYDYKIVYRKGSAMNNADALSRLPVSEPTDVSSCMINFFNIAGNLPLNANDIAKETSKDDTLSKVISFMNSEWPAYFENKLLQKLSSRKLEFSISDEGCLLLGCRVVIPNSLKGKMLELLHEGHMGVVRMKELSRGTMWWLNLDRDIEHYVRTCDACQQENVEKVGTDEGPNKTSSSADQMKPWLRDDDDSDSDSYHTESSQDGRMWD